MNVKRLFVVSLFSLMPVITLAATQIEQIEAWLSKMHKAAHTQNYSGTFVYGQDNKLSTMQIVHSADANGERERLVSMDGTGREVIRNKGSVTCILPDKKSVVVEKSRPNTQFPPAFPMKVKNLAEIYDFKLTDQGYVAGRKVQKLEIMPRDKFRYGHNIWIDMEKGLLLKTNLVDDNGQAIETFMFTSITYMDVIPEKLLTPTISGKNYTWYEADEPKEQEFKHKPDWLVSALPQGFQEDMMRKHKMPAADDMVEHMMFSDGLASVSVFIEKTTEKNDHLKGGSRMGAINAHGRVLNGHHITVVGEVPQPAVRMICESVQKK